MTLPADTDVPSIPGQHLETRVRDLGRALADALERVVAALPGGPQGPQRLAQLLGTTIVNTSRLLKGLGSADPERLLTHLPGPEPLRRLLTAARAKGVDAATVGEARAAVERFDQLIQEEGGDRGTLDAILSAWLPEQRRKFEARRRQSAFKALSELKGASCELDLSALIVHPAAADPARIDLLCLQGMYGLKRLRPDVRVKFGARRLTGDDDDEQRRPTNLDGEPAVDGLSSVRLDEFCAAPPGPLEARPHGHDVMYTLGETGFGPRSAVDIVLGEVNRSELPRGAEPGRRRFFFHLVGTPARRAHFDLFVHRELLQEGEPELVVYDTTGEGPAVVGDTLRDIDRLPVGEQIERLDDVQDALRGTGIPRYADLVGTACAKLGWDLGTLRVYRVAMDHPLLGMQLCMAFPEPAPLT